MKKIITFFTVFVLFFLVSSSIGTSTKAATSTKNNYVTLSGTVDLGIIASYPKSEVSNEDLKFFRELSDKDNNIKVSEDANSITMYETKSYTGVYAKIDNQVAPLKEDGSFTIQALKNENDSYKVNVFNSNNELLTTKEIVLNTSDNKEDNISISKKVTFQDLAEHMDNMDMNDKDMSDNNTKSMNMDMDTEKMDNMDMDSSTSTKPNFLAMAATSSKSYVGQTYSGELVKTGTHVHCNRFNGTWSDHRYWSKSNPKAWKDFLGSDCDRGMNGYHCSSFSSMVVCDGLNRLGKGVKDCSTHNGFPATAWYRN
ncbi:hypothetical protein [Priestia megaterium]|uniref:hypothetical protein n=1 Tax=Priestia megaterium TaxID=1404 RepID=UPI0037499C2A